MAEKVRDYPKLATQIIDLVGGESNITQASRCATRLRLVLAKTPEDAKEKISKLPGVITGVESGGQFQVVIGTHVSEVYDAVSKELDLENRTDIKAPKEKLLNRVIAMMSAVFAPFIYVLAAAGLIQGALILIKMAWPSFGDTGTYQVFSFISWTPFTFLPVFIAITASKFFKVNTYIAVVCCAALMNPTWTALAADIKAGHPLKFLIFNMAATTYTSTVLPPLFLVWALSYLERFLNKILPAVVRQFFTPFLCMIIIVPLTFLVIGPLSDAGANGVADGYNWLVARAPWLAAAIIGAFWQVLVIFGVHWGITPVVLANFANHGSDSFQAFQTAAVIAQVGAAFGVMLKTRSKQMRTVAASASLTGVFGITEPAIYGVTLRLKKPFILGCTAGMIGAIVISLFGSRYYFYAGLPGPLTIMNAYKSGTASLVGEAIGCAIAFFGAAVLVWFLGFDDPVDIPEEADDADTGTAVTDRSVDEHRALVASAQSAATIAAPVTGRVIPLTDVEDPVFASGAMGSGVAILPSDTKVYAPFDGTVVTVLPSKHAVGLVSDDGVEVLIHVGLDTVQLQGKHFTQHVEAKQHVSKGDLLLEFDHAGITEAGYSLVTPVIVTNSKKYDEIAPVPQAVVHHGNDLAAALKGLPVAAENAN